MFSSIINTNSNGLDFFSGVICILVAIVLGILIAFVHKKTSKYSKNFLITLGILPLLVQSVIMLVNGNLGTSVAVLGAFSLIKFRSIPGNSKEIASVLFAMVVGLAIGVGYVYFAILLAVIVSIMIYILSKSNFCDNMSFSQNLKITIPENLDYTSIFDEIFDKYLDECELKKVKTTNMGSMYEIIYSVKIKTDVNQKEFIDALRVKNGNLPIILQRELVEGESML